MNRNFHSPQPVASGVRLRVLGGGVPVSENRSSHFYQPLWLRLLSALVVLIFFFSSSPVVFAMTAREAMGGGGVSAGGKGGAANLQNAGAASASLASTRAREVLQKTDAQVAAMKALQSTARSIMAPVGTQNGLARGWLETRDGFKPDGTPITTSWSGAAITSANGANNINIKQSVQSAYLYWKNFSVGPKTSINFDQSAGGNNAGTWIAFNKVMGNVNPTHIFGSITAQGQVYILNQNGIIFHNGAQVNTHALVASSLPINENLSGDALDGVKASGIANNPDYQFLFSALPMAAGVNGPTPTFTPPVAPAAGIGDVVVEQGASIAAPANASHTGGLVALVGPNVKNGGSISTPNGQTILAAGLQVGLSPHASSDPTLRGMDVYVGKVSDLTVKTVSATTGTAQNNGLLQTPEGDVTISGMMVQQNGVIDSSTSVSLNGRIDLLAVYNDILNPKYKSNGANGQPVLYQDTGVVEIGAGSLMRILPEWNSDATITGTTLALNSVVSITGKQVNLGSGSILQAPGAVVTAGALSETGLGLGSGVTIGAGTWYDSGTHVLQFIYSAGDVTLASGSVIDVSGSTDVKVDSAQNFLTVQLRGAELANSPLQRSGVIRGANITVDERLTGTYNGQYWVGTPLGDATGFAALIQKTVGELTTAGGTVSLLAGNSVNLGQGSTINVSGGWIQYSGGSFSTTKLIYQGHLVDISQATPDRVYSGIYHGGTTETFAKWGITKTFKSNLDPGNKQYEAPYISGATGGSISIQAPSVILNGSLNGVTVAGPRQVRESPTLSTLPTDSSLSIALFGQSIIKELPFKVSPYAPLVLVGQSGLSSQDALFLSPDLVSSDGFGNLSILNHDGSIRLPANTSLDAGVNGSITLEAANITIDGGILAPGGSVSLTADLAPYSVLGSIALLLQPSASILDVVNYQGEAVARYGPVLNGVTQIVQADGTLLSVQGTLPHVQAGIVTLATSSRISTAGTIGNDSPISSHPYLPIAENGGAVSITGYQVNLASGSAVNVSGGAFVPSIGSTTYGKAGSITIIAGQDASIKTIHDGSLRLDSSLQGYGGFGAVAGTLSMTAPAIQIGGSSQDSRIFNLSPSFFNQGGFGTFNLSGIGLNVAGSSSEFVPGIDIASGTTIHPEITSSLLIPADGQLALQPLVQPVPYRQAATLSLTAQGLTDLSVPAGQQLLIRGDLVIGESAQVILDPQLSLSGVSALVHGGSISLKGQSVTIGGAVTVPGGTINIQGAGNFPQNVIAPNDAYLTVDLGSKARLSTAGYPLYVQDPIGIREKFGAVVSGGSISVSGNILAEAGSVLDASGASGVYDLFPYQLGEQSSVNVRTTLESLLLPYEIDSSGGTIALNGSQMLYSDALLRAQSGGPTALGGSLSISSGLFQGGTGKLNLAVNESGSSVPSSFGYSGFSAIGQTISTAGNLSEGGGHIAISSFNQGGFDSLSLSGNVIFNGPVSLSLPGTLKIASGGVLAADSTVNLSASYVALGVPFALPLAQGIQPPSTGLPAPSYGTGSLNITASLIDLGDTSLQNIGSAQFVTPGGAIRGDGTFDIAGALVLKAAQIYPVTDTSFTLAAYNHDSTGAATSLSGQGITPGSITVLQGGQMSLPLSAAGILSLYASSINQGGTLLAPFGSINLGSAGGATAPTDPVSGLKAPTTETLVLNAGSVTSISAVNPFTGVAVTVPFGTSSDGNTWTDPSGTAITTTGLSGKSINLTSSAVTTEAGSSILLQGGGAETATQWIDGNGGTLNVLGTPSEGWSSGTSYNAGTLVSYNGNTWSARQANTDVAPTVGLNWSMLPQYFAILPGYHEKYAPTGYADGSLGIGSQITINGGAGLASGTYTLLPASYGTQPGAYLISAASVSESLAGSYTQPDGSVIASGTEFNGLDSAVMTPKTQTLFQLLSPTLLATHAQYKILSADTFFSGNAAASRPANAGNLVFNASSSLALNGGVSGEGGASGVGASIDISVPGVVDITQKGGEGMTGVNFLGSELLSSWRFGSLLIGGERGTAVNGLTPVAVTATTVALESGASLSGSDIILAANQSIELASDSAIVAPQTGPTIAPDEKLSVNGDGVLIRVSGDPNISFVRTGIQSQATQLAQTDGLGNSTTPTLSLGAGSTLNGSSLILDSSALESFSSMSKLNSQGITVNAGSIALLTDSKLNMGVLNASDSKSLILSGSILAGLESSASLSLNSYSTLDFYGAGSFGSAAMSSLTLDAGEIRGFDLNGLTVSLSAKSILLDNSAGAGDSGPVTATPNGILELNAATLAIGVNTVAIDQFAQVSFNASGEIVGKGSKGGLTAGTDQMPTDLYLTTPLVTGVAGASTSLNATGALILQAPDPGYETTPTIQSGLGAKLSLQGDSLAINSTINLPSGSLEAVATTGDLVVGAQGRAFLDVAGTVKSILNATEYTDAGTISLSSDQGNVMLAAGAGLNLNAQAGAGSAGNLSVNAPKGIITIDPATSLSALGGNGGQNGSFSLDVASLGATGNGSSSLSSIAPALNQAGFTQSQTFRIRTGNVNVDTYIVAHAFSLSADQGSIDVTPNGVMDASGNTGGSISLVASGSVILEPNSFLSVHGDTYDAAGKGGSILLSAGAEINGLINPNALLDIQTASAVDLGVTAPATSIQDFGGVLHLRAPINSDGTDIQVAHLDGTITGASSVEVEGFRLYDLTPAGGGAAEISTQIAKITSDAQHFFGVSGANSSVTTAIVNRLTQNQPSSLSSILNLAPGVEIINRSGDLTLNSDWDFSSFRVGANNAPGFLTLRAADNITLNASLSDGFQNSSYTATLLGQNASLPANFQSWAYQLTAGADIGSANAQEVATTSIGNLALGRQLNGQNIDPSNGANATTSGVIDQNGVSYFQVIRTGTGDIGINTSGDVQLWNQFVSIYTAGVQALDPTLGGTFDTPVPNFNGQGASSLGAVQETPAYPAQFSYAGGNVSIHAKGNINHLTLNNAGLTVADSVRELPSNWLYRRGSVDPATGNFQLMTQDQPNDVASTAWWVDFSNFFEGVGALGGGNVTMNAGHDINNVDALIPTNFRMPGHAAGSTTPIAPNEANGVELGGGDLSVVAANNIDAGVYYVEKGNGSLKAGGSIITNPTRDPVVPQSINPTSVQSDNYALLPTTLFLGKGSFSVHANGDVLLGPVANVFLTPQGISNSFWYKTYFSTYAPNDSVTVESLGGNIIFREAAESANSGSILPILQLWMGGFINAAGSLANENISYYQPWLRLAEADIGNLGSLFSLAPPTLNAAAPAGNIIFQGNYTTSPSPSGNIFLAAEGSINGLAAAGQQYWDAAQINLSNANPDSIPGVASPLSQRSTLGASASRPANNYVSTDFVFAVSDLFTQTGSYYGANGSLQKKQSLNDSTLLHSGDTQPLHLYAQNGDISGLTLYSAKQSDIIAGGDITDIGLYVQNNAASDVSIISAGGNITTYDPTSLLQQQAQSAEIANLGQSTVPLQSGDIQINGPGTLEVLAGGNVDLGNNPGNASDPTLSVGITSIGNSRNPALPFAGADIIVSAGVKLPTGLSSVGGLGLETFTTTVVNGPDGSTYISELAETMTYSGAPLTQPITAASFAPESTQLSAEEKARLELQLFYIVLRDTGRNHNKIGSPGYGSYASGEKAIQALLGSSASSGNIITWSQDIATVNGGNINLLASGGGLTLSSVSSKTTSVAPGIITEGGGGINIYTKSDVSIGIGRIFTLKGGDIMIWSNDGNIAAGSSAKTVQSAPPTQVLIDPQSGNVETDLAGLATGGGIGVLETVVGVPPGNVDLIAPTGVIDAGDAGIRSSGNLNLAATQILNADNIAASGTTAGAPPAAPPPAAPNISGASAAAAAGAANNSAAEKSTTPNNSADSAEAAASIISVEVLGYGGGDGEDDNSLTPGNNSPSVTSTNASL